jgi:Fe-S-cluster containining protein
VSRRRARPALAFVDDAEADADADGDAEADADADGDAEADADADGDADADADADPDADADADPDPDADPEAEAEADVDVDVIASAPSILVANRSTVRAMARSSASPPSSPAAAAAAVRAERVTKAFGELSAGKRRHLPVIRPRDVLEIAAVFHRTIDGAAGFREREITDDGATLACAAGCSSCCHTAVMVYEPEAMRVAELLARSEQAEARAHFLAQYPAWQAALGKDVERISTLHAMGRIEDAERIFFRLQVRRVMCAFNREGLCTVYEARPAVCRNTHALETPDSCQPGAAHGPTIMGSAPIDRLMAQLPGVMGPLQDALRREEDGPPDALCAAVHRLLTRPPPPPIAEPARNAPCPCGSGEKYKHCCDF